MISSPFALCIGKTGQVPSPPRAYKIDLFQKCVSHILRSMERDIPQNSALYTEKNMMSMHEGTLVPTFSNNDSTPVVGMEMVLKCIHGQQTATQSAATSASEAEKKLGKPKLVMLFIMRPNLCDTQDSGASGCRSIRNATESQMRFCNGSIQTLQTAVRISGAGSA